MTLVHMWALLSRMAEPRVVSYTTPFLPSLQVQAEYLTDYPTSCHLSSVPALIFCIPRLTPHSEGTLHSRQLLEESFHLCALPMQCLRKLSKDIFYSAFKTLQMSADTIRTPGVPS